MYCIDTKEKSINSIKLLTFMPVTSSYIHPLSWGKACARILYRPISRVVIGREVNYRSRLVYVRYGLTNTTLCL